jgi:small GTP-binding protein
MSSKPCYRVVLLGDGGVGKSAITLQFTTNQFSADYDPTIEDAYRVDTTVDGEDVVLDVLDTAGQVGVEYSMHYRNTIPYYFHTV